MVYLFHMLMQSIQREMHTSKDLVTSYGLFISYVNAVNAKDIESVHILAHNFLNV